MRRRWLAGIFAVSVVWAVLVGAFSSDSVHRLWGVMAACGYALALLAVIAIRNARASDVALGLSFVGALIAPLAWMAAKGLEQPEVYVVARSGAMLIHQGTPYTSAAALAATQNPNAYNPYLPVMALFGLPRALFDLGLLTDPRVWFGVVFLIVFWLALRRGGAQDPGRWTVLVAGSPVIAFELAVGGTDVPMVGFLCLGFALLYPRRESASVSCAVLAGLALGIASAMKATAWPALAVAFVLLLVRDGWKAAWAFTLTALAVVAVCVGPFFAIDPKTVFDNTIKFPLGLASVRSAASSPLLGHIISSTWPGAGHTIVVVLLVLAGLAVAAVAGVPAAAHGVARGRAAGGGDDADVPARPVDPVRLLHLPGGARDLAARRARRAAGRGRRATPDPGGPAASSHTTVPTIAVERPAG